MQSQVNEISPVLVEIGVEIPWEKINRELEEAYINLQHTVRLRGFRPGKVPLNVVRQVMGKKVKMEVTNSLVQKGIEAAVIEHSLEPVSIPSLDPPEIKTGSPLSFSAQLEIRPRIESVDTTSLQIERPFDEVSEEDIAKEIERLREQSAELITPEKPRPSTKGDVLTIDYNVFIDEEKRDDLSATDRQIEIGMGHLLPELEEGLIGLSPGTQKSVEITLPDYLPMEDIRGAKAIFEVSVKEMREKVLPEVDDELAKDLSYDSINALKNSIRERLQKNAKQRAEAQIRERLLDSLVDQNPIPVPPTLLDLQKQSMTRDLLQLQKMMGREGPIEDEMLKNLGERAERNVRAQLLLSHIARTQKIEVTDENIEKTLHEMAASTGKHIAKIRAEYQGEKREMLETQLMEKKLVDYLLSTATIKEVDKEPEQITAEPSGEEEK